MELKKEFNQVAKYKPTYVRADGDVKKAADFLKRLKYLREVVKERFDNERKELVEKLAEIENKYDEILKKIDETEGEVRGKVVNYAKNKIASGELLEKKISGEVGSITFIADKEVEVVDLGQLIKAIAEGKYPTTLLQPRLAEIKKYVKATQKNIEGCNIENTVYFRLT